MARRIDLGPDGVSLAYSGISALTRLSSEIEIPYTAIRSVSVGLDEVPSAFAFRMGLSTAPFGSRRKGQFWWAGRRLFLDFEDPDRAVVLDLKDHRLARVAVQPDTSPEELADKIRQKVSSSRP